MSTCVDESQADREYFWWSLGNNCYLTIKNSFVEVDFSIGLNLLALLDSMMEVALNGKLDGRRLRDFYTT